MKRKFGKKNIVLFMLFSVFVLLIIILFGYSIYRTFSYDKTIYDILTGSFMYDKENNYVLLEKDAKLQRKWDKHYYLTYDDTKVDLGEDAIVYHSDDYQLGVYGNNYEVLENGDVKYNDSFVKVARNGFPSFYKLGDRRYLIVSKSITTENKEINTSGYLIVEIDKNGNALLMNNELNIKTLSTIVLHTSKFDFDVAKEKLLVGEDNIIDLKKINGSTNQYVEPTLEDEEKDKDKDKDQEDDKNDKNNQNNNNSSGGSSGHKGGSVGGNSTTVNSNEKLNIVKSASLTGITGYTSYVDVTYIVNDPKNEYLSVYLVVEGANDFNRKIVLNKDKNRYRIRDLLPNSEYTISFAYTYASEGNKDVLMDEVANVVKVKTAKNNSKITITKVSANKVYFNVKYDSSYAYESANIVLYSDNQNVGTLSIDTDEAISAKGFTGHIDAGIALGYTITLKLENCVFQGENVTSTVQTKFINR